MYNYYSYYNFKNYIQIGYSTMPANGDKSKQNINIIKSWKYQKEESNCLIKHAATFSIQHLAIKLGYFQRSRISTSARAKASNCTSCSFVAGALLFGASNI